MKISGRKIDPGFLKDAPMERVPCRLCGGNALSAVADADCIGLPVKTVMCRTCGLIFLNPRPAAEWYRQFYSSLGGRHHEYNAGVYTGDEKPIGTGFERARAHGRALGERLGAHLKPGVTIDVGSSEGGVLAGLGDRLSIRPVGIEPVPAEAEYATARGIPTHAALIEDVTSLGIRLPEAANVVCVKSLNHFLDPAHFFGWAWSVLGSDGRLMLEVKNFLHQVRRSGRIRSGIQVDHPYMYVPETLSAFVRRAGFDILVLDVDEGKRSSELRAQEQSGLPAGHVRLVARKTERQPFRVPFEPDPIRVASLRCSLAPLNLYGHYLVRYANLKQNIRSRLGI